MVLSFFKWSMCLLLCVLLLSASPKNPHPVHISVVEINHNPIDKTLEISCKLFTDDLEGVLRQNYNTKVDLINPPDQNAMDSLVKKYILSHFSIRVDNRPLQFTYLGFERDHESVYAYIQAESVPVLQKISIINNLMYDFFTDQINIMHVSVGGKRISKKLDYPDTEIGFSF